MIELKPSYDESAERAVLGTMLADPESIPTVVEYLSEEDFYLEEHRLLFSIILKLWQEHGTNWDEIVLRDRLKKEGLEERLPFDWIIGVFEEAAPLKTLETACNVVKEHSDKRKLGDIILKSVASLKKGVPSAEIIRSVLDSFLKVAGDLESIYDKAKIVRLVSEYVEEARNRTSFYTGIPSGFDVIDEATNGFRGGEMIVVGARPGVGKTTFLVTLLENFRLQGKKVAFFSLEMPPIALGLKIASMVTGISFEKLLSGYFTDEEYDSFLEKLVAYAKDETPVYIDFRKHNHRSLLAALYFLKKKADIDIVMIDYFQLVDVKPGRGESMKDAYSKLSTDLKNLAKQLDIPIIVASQLKREAEKKDKPPTIGDLKETGQLEQDADQIFLMWRNDKNEEVVNVRLAKNRLLGKTVKFELEFDKSTHSYRIKGRESVLKNETYHNGEFSNDWEEIPF